MALRLDAIKLPAVSKTAEGYLRGDAAVTRAGVFQYRRADGSIRRELRHPTEVFDADSLDSLRMIPVTIGHPGLVTAATAKQVSVGATGEQARVRGGHVVTSVNITDESAVRTIEAGKRDLSLGYTAEVIEEPGTYDGEPYDARQTKIRYNHLGIVDSARAGPGARLRLDGEDAQLVTDEGANMGLVKIKLDGIDYEASPEVANALTKAQARADAAESTAKAAAEKAAADVAAAQALTTKATARADEAEAALKKHQAELPNAVKARVELVGVAGRILKADALKDTMTDDEIRRAVIVAKHPDVKLDGQTPEYVRARFDLIAEQLDGDAMAKQRQDAGGGGGGSGQRQDSDPPDADAARQRMIDAQRKAYQSNGKGA